MVRKKFGIIVLMIFCVMLVGCSNSSKEYSSQGFSIKMEDGMYQKELEATTVAFMNEKVIVTALKEEFTALESLDISESSSIADYAEVLIDNNNADYELQNDGGLNYFEYEQNISDKDYYYVTTIYKSDDAFWLVNFTCDKSNKNEYKDKFFKWAKTVDFD